MILNLRFEDFLLILRFLAGQDSGILYKIPRFQWDSKWNVRDSKEWQTPWGTPLFNLCTLVRMRAVSLDKGKVQGDKQQKI